MARHGVSYLEVVEAANEVLGLGKNLTIENVRLVLGTGSLSTINKYLRQWKESQSSSESLALKEQLPAEFVELMKGLWERILAQANDKVLFVEENYKGQLNELNNEVQKYKNNNTRWQKLYEQWKIEKNKLEKENLTIQQALDFSLKENSSLHVKQDALLQEVNDKKDRIEEIQRLHKQAQENLEHYRKESRELRLLDLQQFENQKQLFQTEIKKLSSQYKSKELEVVAQQGQIKLTEQNYNALKASHDKLSNEMLNLVNKINLINSENVNLQKQLKEISNTLAITQKNLVARESENRNLLQKIISHTEEVRYLENEIARMNKQAWELSQEKFQLSQRLKEMQKELEN